MRCVITYDNQTYSVVEHFISVANAAQDAVRFDKIQMLPADHRLFPVRGRLSGASACRRALRLKRRRNIADDDFLIAVVVSKIFDFEDDEYLTVSPIDYPNDLPDQPRVGVISCYYERTHSEFKRPRNRRLQQDQHGLWSSFSPLEQDFLDENVLLLCLLNIVSVLLGAQTKHRRERSSRGCINDYDEETYEVLRALRHGFYFCGKECQRALRRSGIGRAILAISDCLTAVPLNPELREVFVSYASEDRRTVRPLVTALKTLGLRVWFDDYDIVPGRTLLS